VPPAAPLAARNSSKPSKFEALSFSPQAKASTPIRNVADANAANAPKPAKYGQLRIPRFLARWIAHVSGNKPTNAASQARPRTGMDLDIGAAIRAGDAPQTAAAVTATRYATQAWRKVIVFFMSRTVAGQDAAMMKRV
jgi:hypothetical protein